MPAYSYARNLISDLGVPAIVTPGGADEQRLLSAGHLFFRGAVLLTRSVLAGKAWLFFGWRQLNAIGNILVVSFTADRRVCTPWER